ncbi:MAG: D-alanine--D-alanine ligase [Nitrospirae bacterium]|nr:D-alanine--D-alanine ligase [Nitrospirota bacterium]
MRIAVLMGGPSSERDVSLKSGKAVEETLREAGLKVIAIEVDEEVEKKLRDEKIEVAFLALHGRYGEDGTVQEMLERLGITYTGSGVEASRIAFDKIASKKAFLREGIDTPAFYVLEKGNKREKMISQFPFHPVIRNPLVVKPAREGSTIGVSVARKEEEYLIALDRAFQYDERILVEEYIAGREITVGILNGSPLPIVEILPRKEFFDFEAKYTEGLTDFKIPASLSSDVYREAQDLALKVHRILACRGVSRVDMKVNNSGKLYVLEVNTIPGMTPCSLLPKAAQAAGISFLQLCCKLIEIALRDKA